MFFQATDLIKKAASASDYHRPDLNLCFQNKSKLSDSKAFLHILCFQRLYCFVMIAKDFYPQSTWKHIVIPSLTFHPNCCLGDCACLGCYSSMAHLETKSRGCHGSARIDGVLKCQNDKHRADVPWDSNPACL